LSTADIGNASKGFADVTLDTQRLRLRQPDERDLDDLFAMFAHPETTRYWSSTPWTEMQQARDWLRDRQVRHADGSALMFVLELRETGHAIGTCTLFNFHTHCRRAEVGYLLHPDYWHHGYMHEALRAMFAHGFDAMDLRRLEADIDPANTASRRVLERMGFVREGRLRERWEVDGKITDSDIYGLLRREWNG
jgi:[ribosomal protein S5]-alanine N-acetyltransferase